MNPRTSTAIPTKHRVSSPVPRSQGARFILLIVIIAAAYFIPRGVSWNADTHIFLTASIVDRGSLNIDPFAHYTGDLSYAHGHYYADKAPGLSMLAIPIYLLLKYTLLGGHPYAALFSVPPAQRIDFMPRYMLALVYAAVPTGILSSLLYTFLARFGLSEKRRAFLALTYGLGTIAFPFAGEFFSHQLASLLIFGAFLLIHRIRHSELSSRYLLPAGFLLGYSIITEYPTALLAVLISLYAFAPTSRLQFSHRTLEWAHLQIPLFRPLMSKALFLLSGASLPLALGALYNTCAFGGPFSQGYAHLVGPEAFRIGQAQGFMGVTFPHLDALWQTTLGPYRGLFFLSPVLLLAIPGFIWLWRRAEWRAETLLWISIVLVYGIFSVSYFAWDGGYSIGPRQFLAALPFLIVPIGEVLRPDHSRRWHIAAIMLGAYSVLVISLSTAVGPLVDPRFAAPLTQWTLPRLAGLIPDAAHPATYNGSILAALAAHAPLFITARIDNNWGMLFGLPGLLQLLPLWCIIAAILAWHWRAELQKRVITAFRSRTRPW